MGDSAARFKAEVLRRLDTVLDGQEDALHQAATIFANTIERGGIIRAFGSRPRWCASPPGASTR